MIWFRIYLAVADPSKDPVSARTSYTGVRGKAWDINLYVNPDGSKRADVAHWVVERPDVHPFWHSYAVILFHLRPIDGLPPPYLARLGATHEFWLAALDPRVRRQSVIESGAIPHLRPANFASQIIAGSDAEAYGMIYRDVVKAICDGSMNPDTDFFTAWVEKFGDWMVRK